MTQDSLFAQAESAGQWAPLAARLRPSTLEDYVGQQQVLAPGKPLFESISKGQLHSFILWGPPGVGKTTLAQIAAKSADAVFTQISAVLSGVKEIRAAVDEAKAHRLQGRKTVLFVDEAHRFNKSQQDAFLPHVEDGTLIFIGATTENPSFELNAALLSRARVYRLTALDSSALSNLLDRALRSFQDGGVDTTIEPEAAELLIQVADGDARRLLTQIEMVMDLIDQKPLISLEDVQQVAERAPRRFDKGGDMFYDLISALHKSVRGSDPDAALYWFARMLDGGCDPLYIARRAVRMASEDIGNADPRALELALNAWQVQERLGSPEGELAVAQAIVYMACAAKSNAVYTAFKHANKLAAESGSLEVPIHLRNAPTKLMAEQGFGRAYRYAHDEPEAFAAGEVYLPPELAGTQLYQPVPRGLEIKISEKLERLKALNQSVLEREERKNR